MSYPYRLPVKSAFNFEHPSMWGRNRPSRKCVGGKRRTRLPTCIGSHLLLYTHSGSHVCISGYYPHNTCLLFIFLFVVAWETSGSFEVLHDDVDSNELTVRLSNLDTGESLYTIPSGVQEGDFELTDLKKNAPLQLCFQSNVEGDNAEDAFDIGFNLRYHEPPRTLEDQESGPDGEKAAQLVEKAAKIHQNWDTLQDHFDFLRNREAIHEEMNDEIVSRLTKWTYLEAVLVVSMAIGQVMYWKKFFEKRRYL